MDRRAEPSKDQSFWPLWLARDIPGLNVYTLSYEAPASGWLGTAMPLQDRAVNVRETLLGEAALRACPLTFICHSLGGLIVKQLILDLKEQEARRPEAAALLEQIRQVVFLATPHTGSRKASLLQHLWFLAWPTPVARSLIANDPSLRKINVSYRGLVDDRKDQLAHKAFYETLDTSAGRIVDEASADPGLRSEPIGIHANHMGISKPADPQSDVYKLTRAFLALPLEKKKPNGAVAIEALPVIQDEQPWNLVPKLARVAALILVGVITYKGVQALIAPLSIPAEQIQNITQQQAAILAELQQQGKVQEAAAVGLGERMIADLARRLKPDEQLDLAQAVIEISAAVDIAIKVIAEGKGGGSESDLVNTVLARIAEKTKANDLNGAAREADAGFAQWEKQEAERRQASLKAGIALLEAGIKQDLLLRDPAAAAKRVERIVALEHPDDPAARFWTLFARQDEWYIRGRDKGINLDLAVSIELARLAYLAAKNSVEKGSALINLGNALWALGGRESGTARLEEAVEAYRSALEELTRERVPLDWAVTQNNLGNALRTLGERESGTARLDEAVAAYRLALEERTRDRVPLDWAMTQNNLGAALKTLGGRENGTARLDEAVAAFRLALEEWTRERVPLDWAMTQYNLGNALAALGGRESNTAKLEEAVTALRLALEEYTRERVPLYWATTQHTLGTALHTLGGRESGTARLDEAVAAFRLALEEWTRERVPLDWAMTQNSLGNALRTLGERESGTARLEEAVEAYRLALEEWTRERVPLYWAATQNNLGNALRTLGERESGTARLEEAVKAYRLALEERTRERVPLDWAMTQNNLGNALRTLAERESGTAKLEEAVKAHGSALEEWTRERVPLDWAMTQNNLGNALRTLGERESGTARLDEAVEAYRAALEERTRERVPLDWAISTGNQGVAMRLIAERRRDLALAEAALGQIQAALDTCRAGGHTANAAFFESELAKAQARVAALKAK